MSGIDDSGPLFLPSSIIHRLHARSLAEHGGLEGIGDPSGLESAIAAPQNVHFYEGGDLFEIAAAYAFHIAESQAFLDGNKRAAASAALRTATLYRIGSTIESRFGRLHSGAFGSTGGASLFLHLPDDLGRSVALAGAVGEFADVVEEFSLVDLYNLAGFQIEYVAGLVL